MTTTLSAKEIEQKWQKKWQEDAVFTPKRDLSKEKFFTTVPYPYANSAMHIGHGRGYTTPDIFNRFQRLQGKNVLFPLGYHISGTPVLAVADGIKRKDEVQIATTRDAISDIVPSTEEQDKIIETFKEPENIASFFSKTIKDALNSVGISIDWTREFSTGDDSYKQFISWQFKKLKECGILVQGKYPILYSPSDENAVGEDDIKDGDSDKVSVQEMSYILFELKEDQVGSSPEKVYIAVATLRPDALFGTTNLWVSEDIPLVKILFQGQQIIIGKEALIKLQYQFDNIKVLTDINPKELIGKRVITPLINREVGIAKASFLDAKHGTGIVYSSPAGAPHDFIALIEAQKEKRIGSDVVVINTVNCFDKKGNQITYKGSCPAEDKILKYTVTNAKDEEGLEKAKTELYKEEHYGGILNELCGEFEGIPIKHAKEKILKALIHNKKGGVFYETSRRAQTRSGNDVIVANLDGQWFLDYTKEETKSKAHELLESMTYFPHKMKATQKGYLDWVQMRPCARKRGIGTPLPFDKKWVIESLSDSTIYQLFYLLVKIINEQKIDSEKLTEEVFDYVLLGKGDERELPLDREILLAMREEILYWKTFDFRYTAGNHLSNHLSFLIYHYALLFPKELHPKTVAIGGMLIKDGHKISKSKGNGIPLVRVKEKYGADLYRLYIATSANYDIELDFKDADIQQLGRKFERWKTLMISAAEKEIPSYDTVNHTNKWLISRFYSYTKEYIELFENLRIREAYVGVLFEFLNDIAYHERKEGLDETLKVIRFILADHLKIMSPAIPHICEEIYEKINTNKEYISLATFTTPVEKFINKEAEERELIVQNIIGNVTKFKTTRNIQSLSKITIIQADEKRFLLFDDLKELLIQKKEIKTILKSLNEKYKEETNFIQKFVPKTLGNGLDFYFSKKHEKEFLESLIPFLKKEFNCDIEIISTDQKHNTAIPSKPGILVE